MRTPAAIPLAAILMASVSAPAIAQSARETLPDAIASALASNPDILAQRKTRAAADEELEQAKSAMRPTLSLSGTYSTLHDEPGVAFPLPTGGTFPPSGSYQRDTAGLEARQSIYSGGALSAQRRGAEAGVLSARARLSGAEQQLVLDTATAFIDVRRAEAEVDIRNTDVESLKKEVEAADDRFKAGEITRTDVAQTEARYAGSQANYAAAQSLLAAARAQFERLVGRPAVQLAEPPAAPGLPATLEEAIEAARHDNPNLTALRSVEDGSKQAVAAARGALRPQIGLVGNAGLTDTYVDNSYRDTSLSATVRLSIPLYEGGLLASRTREAQLNADRAHLEVLSAERQVTAQVTSAWHTVASARQAIAASSSQVAAAETAMEGAQQEFSVGTRITLDVLDQERELLQARLGLVESQRAEYVAVMQLLAALGRLNPGVFGR